MYFGNKGGHLYKFKYILAYDFQKIKIKKNEENNRKEERNGFLLKLTCIILSQVQLSGSHLPNRTHKIFLPTLSQPSSRTKHFVSNTYLIFNLLMINQSLFILRKFSYLINF